MVVLPSLSQICTLACLIPPFSCLAQVHLVYLDHLIVFPLDSLATRWRPLSGLRRTLMDSISRSLEVLYEMPYTTDFPPGLPADLEQILRDLHASTERLMDEVTRTNRLLHRLAMFPPHALPTQPWLPDAAVLPHFPPCYGPAAPPPGTSSPS